MYMYGCGCFGTHTLPLYWMNQLFLSNFCDPIWLHTYLQQEFLAENSNSLDGSSTIIKKLQQNAPFRQKLMNLPSINGEQN